MKKLLVISMLLAIPILCMPCLSKADTPPDAWGFSAYSSYSTNPKVKVTATLTYTDTSTGTTNTIPYKPIVKSFKLERNINSEQSNVETSVILRDDVALMDFSASASGTGLTSSKTDITCVMNNELEPKFDFNDFLDPSATPLPLTDYKMDEPSMLSLSATGSYTEKSVTTKTTPSATLSVISVTVKYVITGTVKVKDYYYYPAKIVVQITGSNIQAVK